ncbi:phosphoribosylaminoimidazolesuccinocarboxamide synthase, partial [filamentous cyanobacterium CCP5]
VMALASAEQIAELWRQALEINGHLCRFFAQCEITLVDFKLEFGFDSRGRLILADEISPDTCRLWDRASDDPQQRVLDKDRFRQDLGKVEAAYQEVLRRVLAHSEK